MARAAWDLALQKNLFGSSFKSKSCLISWAESVEEIKK